MTAINLWGSLAMVVGGTARVRLAALAVVCALLVTSFPLALASAETNEVTMLGESAAAEEEQKLADVTSLTYLKWAQEDQRLLSKFVPPPPPEPQSAQEQAETIRWAMMRGLKQDLVDAKLAWDKHTVRKQNIAREESDRETMQSYIQQALLKAKIHKQMQEMTNKPAPSEETPQQVDKAMKDKAKAAAKEDTALEEAEFLPAPDEDW